MHFNLTVVRVKNLNLVRKIVEFGNSTMIVEYNHVIVINIYTTLNVFVRSSNKPPVTQQVIRQTHPLHF